MLETFVVSFVLLHTPGKPTSKLEIPEPVWKRREEEENTYFLGCSKTRHMALRGDLEESEVTKILEKVELMQLNLLVAYKRVRGKEVEAHELIKGLFILPISLA